MGKNVVDNLVSVELNQSYKLLLVSCLLDQKKFFFHEKRKHPGRMKLIERNQTKQLFLSY